MSVYRQWHPQPSSARPRPARVPTDTTPEVMVMIRRDGQEFLAEDLETGVWAAGRTPGQALSLLAMKLDAEIETIRETGRPGTRLYDWWAEYMGWPMGPDDVELGARVEVDRRVEREREAWVQREAWGRPDADRDSE
jgi:hypothetical protein